MATCQVKHCRYPNTHLTCAHRCGSCNQLGHGRLECNKPDKIRRLESICIVVDHYNCTVPGCQQPWSHSNRAHVCDQCNNRENCVCYAQRIVEKTCPTCKVSSNVNTNYQLFTGSDCVVCLQSAKMIVFENCHHANVCLECLLKL